MVDADWEKVDLARPLPRPGSPLMGGYDEGNGAGVDGQQGCSMGRPPQLREPEAMPASGSDRDQEWARGEAGIDGRIVGYSYPYPNAEGSVPDRGGNDVHGEEDRRICSRSSTPSMLRPHGGESRSARTWRF